MFPEKFNDEQQLCVTLDIKCTLLMFFCLMIEYFRFPSSTRRPTSISYPNNRKVNQYRYYKLFFIIDRILTEESYMYLHITFRDLIL